MKHGRGFFIGTLVTVTLAMALALLAAGGQVSRASPGVIYVDADATGRNNGGSWRNAYTDLQDALDEAEPLNQIWVAAGTYKPDWTFLPIGAQRLATFKMVNGVAIYGGFDPGEGVTKFEDRDWVAHEAILSGDIGIEGDPSDNVYHVFYHHEGTDLDSTAILDGFTITGGNADSVVYPDGLCGGGMYNHGSSPTLRNLTFVGNSGFDRGGGIYNVGSSPVLTGCVFSNNSAGDGGGIYNYGASSPALIDCTFSGNAVFGFGGAMLNNDHSSPVLANCTFSGNSAFSGGGGAIYNRYGSSPQLAGCTFAENATLGDGGGIYNVASSPVLTNCTFTGNSAGDSGGALYNLTSSSPLLTNCILWGDTAGGLPSEIANRLSSPMVVYSDIQGGYLGAGNIDADPLFVDPDTGDLHLQPNSPCIDVGDNRAPNLPLVDFEGDPRILDGDSDGEAIVDMGVDEVQPPRIPVEIKVTPYIPDNTIKLRPATKVDVAVLTTVEFDAADVDPATVVFAGARAVLQSTSMEDVDDDGDLDMVLYFKTKDLDLDPGDKTATLDGETIYGDLITGTDKVKVIE